MSARELRKLLESQNRTSYRQHRQGQVDPDLYKQAQDVKKLKEIESRLKGRLPITADRRLRQSEKDKEFDTLVKKAKKKEAADKKKKRKFPSLLPTPSSSGKSTPRRRSRSLSMEHKYSDEEEEIKKTMRTPTGEDYDELVKMGVLSDPRITPPRMIARPRKHTRRSSPPAETLSDRDLEAFFALSGPILEGDSKGEKLLSEAKDTKLLEEVDEVLEELSKPFDVKEEKYAKPKKGKGRAPKKLSAVKLLEIELKKLRKVKK